MMLKLGFFVAKPKNAILKTATDYSHLHRVRLAIITGRWIAYLDQNSPISRWNEKANINENICHYINDAVKKYQKHMSSDNDTNSGDQSKLVKKVFMENCQIDRTKSKNWINYEWYLSQSQHKSRIRCKGSNKRLTPTMSKSHLGIMSLKFYRKYKKFPPFFTSYATTSKNFDVYEHLLSSQIERQNSDNEKHALDVMFFVIKPFQDTLEERQKEDTEFALRYEWLKITCNFSTIVWRQKTEPIGK